MFLDPLIHQGLGDGWFIGLIMAMAAIAHQVHYHILVEAHAELQGQPGGKQDHLWVIAIDVEDGGCHHLGHVGGVAARAHVPRVAGGEADLIVDDDMDRTAHGKASGARHVEAFRDHALACHGGIPMDQDGKHMICIAVADAFLACSYRPQYHGVDDFQMGRVEGQGDMHGMSLDIEIGGKTHVIFHISRTFYEPVVVAFEFLEEILG